MPINPNIPGLALANPLQPFNLLGTIADVQVIKHRQALAQKEQREEQARAQMQQMAEQYPDPEDFIGAVSKIDPMKAQEFAEQWEKAKTAKLKTHAEGLTVRTAALDSDLRMLRVAGEDPTKYAKWRARMAQKAPDLDAFLPAPEQWADPAVRQQLFQMGDTIANTIKDEQTLAQGFLKGDYREPMAQAIANAPNLQVARSYLEKARGIAPKGDIQYFEGILASAPDFPTAQAQIAASTVSEKERQDLAIRTKAEARQVAKEARDAANDATRLGYEGERVGLERQRVAMARQAAAEGGAGAKPGDVALVDAIIKNPGLYAGMTPTTKERLVGPLMAKGFTGFSSGAAGKPSTGLQKKALGYFNRAQQASEEIERLQESGLGLGGQTYAEYAPNFMQTQQGQAYNAAQRAFTEARLRKDSGAAIPEQEFVSDRNTYFRKPGDSDATLAQKRRGRAAMLASLAFEAGPALSEYYGDEAENMLAGLKSATTIGGGGGQNAGGGHKINDIVTVKGRQVRITKVLANGQFEGVPAQ